jgi:hypothetical protein
MLEEEDVGRINLAHKIVIDVHLATQKWKSGFHKVYFLAGYATASLWSVRFMKCNFIYHFLAVCHYSGRRLEGKRALGRPRYRCRCEDDND